MLTHTPHYQNYGLEPEAVALMATLAWSLPSPPQRPYCTVPVSDSFWELVRICKCAGLLRSALIRLHAPDEAVARRLKTDQLTTLRSNLAQLAETIECQVLLSRHGIEALAFKGVVRQQQLYGRTDMRSSSDVDMLVQSNDYTHAREILIGAGYRSGVSANSRWWHHHLGESPYLPAPPRRFIVDLHHRLQQPGAPAPRNLSSLFHASAVIRFGGRSVSTLSSHTALLVAVISYSKAVRDLTPWLAYAHEIAFARYAMPPAELQAFDEMVANQGMSRLIEHAFKQTDILWDSATRAAAGMRLDHTERAVIQSALGQCRGRPFRRSALRWAWMDGMPVSRLFGFFAMATREYQSNATRRKEERTKARSR